MLPGIRLLTADNTYAKSLLGSLQEAACKHKATHSNLKTS